MELLGLYSDALIAIGQIGIVIITFPMLVPDDRKPPLCTCIGTTICMAIITIGVMGAELAISVATSFIVTTQWLLVSIQRYQLNTSRRILFIGLWIRWNNFMCFLGR